MWAVSVSLCVASASHQSALSPGHWLSLQFPSAGRLHAFLLPGSISITSCPVTTINRSASMLPDPVPVWEHNGGPCPDRC